MIRIADILNLEHTEHTELFEGAEYPWEVLPVISEYLQYHFENNAAEVKGEVHPAAHIEGDVSIGEGSVVEPGAVIHGPTIIGKNTTIRTGAYIRGNVIIGDECLVGNSTEVKNAVFLNNAVAPHFNYIGDSVLGYKAHLGSSVVLSNIKTPPKEIIVTTLEEHIETGLVKFGAIIGDEVEVGANAVLNPGTVVGARSVIYPLALIRGVVNPDTIVKVRQQQEVVTKRPFEEL